jgi:hypothetical protein
MVKHKGRKYSSAISSQSLKYAPRFPCPFLPFHSRARLVKHGMRVRRTLGHGHGQPGSKFQRDGRERELPRGRPPFAATLCRLDSLPSLANPIMHSAKAHERQGSISLAPETHQWEQSAPLASGFDAEGATRPPARGHAGSRWPRTRAHEGMLPRRRRAVSRLQRQSILCRASSTWRLFQCGCS